MAACLAIVQREHGYVRPDAERAVADDYLGMPPISVREITTFYNMVNQQPLSSYKLSVCTNRPCQLRDGGKALHHLPQRLLMAVIPGGASAPVLPASIMMECMMDFDSIAKAGSMLGAAAVILMDETRDMV